MVYPQHFPSDCPPPQSDIASGEFYRLIQDPKDFLSWREENPNKECSPTLSECQACGVSIHSSLDDIKKLSLRIPRLRNRKIAKGFLKGEMGKIKHTPSKNEKSHHTWWIPEKTEPWKAFEILDTNK